MEKKELHERSGVARTTYDNLEHSTRKPRAHVINALADALRIDRAEARALAGLGSRPPAPGDPDDIRTAVRNSTTYSDAQKAMLLQLMDVIDEANANRQSGR